MSKTISINVPGEPMGKPRMTRRDKWKKRDCVVRYHAFADHVRLCVRQQVGTLPDAMQVTRFDWVAFFAPPPSWRPKRRLTVCDTLHRAKPDKDNVEKGLFDILYPKKDSAIAWGEGKKVWGAISRIQITIEYEPKADSEAARLPASAAA